MGAPWTLLVYIINQQSPKKNLKEDFFKNEFLINRILLILEKFLKIHIKNQIYYYEETTHILITISWLYCFYLNRSKDLISSDISFRFTQRRYHRYLFLPYNYIFVSSNITSCICSKKYI